MTLLFLNQCSNKVCYKGIALYQVITIVVWADPFITLIKMLHALLFHVKKYDFKVILMPYDK